MYRNAKKSVYVVLIVCGCMVLNLLMLRTELAESWDGASNLKQFREVRCSSIKFYFSRILTKLLEDEDVDLLLGFF